MSRVPLYLIILAVALGTTACGSEPAPGSRAGSVAGDWALEMGTAGGDPLAPAAGAITLSIAGADASGTSGCNSYFGTVEIVGATVRFSGLGGTDMACEPDRMALERAYLDALGTVQEAATDRDQLVLTGDGVELRFDPVIPVEPSALVGTVWVLEAVVAGGTTSSPLGDRATLELRDDGSLVGSTGCRGIDGRFVIEGGRVLMPDMIMSDDLCPVGTESQDSHVVTVLGDGFTPTIDGDVLTLSDPDGSGLVYRRGDDAAAAETVGTTWVLVEASIDQMSPDLAGREITLVYDGGSFSGTTPCGTYEIGVTIEGNTVSMAGSGSQTERACPDGSELDNTYLRALQRAETFDRIGDRLLVRGENAYLGFEVRP